MKLLFRQRFFSWFDSYDIFDEAGNTVYTVEGKLSWGHKLVIYDAAGRELGTVKEAVLTFLPRFELICGGEVIGSIQKAFSLLRPRFSIDLNGWDVEGDFFGWDYQVTRPDGSPVATVSKELWNFTDTYSIEIYEPADALVCLMLVLAIDAEKCSK